MPKRKSPTFVSEPPNLFALNRAARRKARRLGLDAIYVPMPQLRADRLPPDFYEREYFLVHVTGERQPYTPYRVKPKDAGFFDAT
jgi:hypothetical protein